MTRLPSIVSQLQSNRISRAIVLRAMRHLPNEKRKDLFADSALRRGIAKGYLYELVVYEMVVYEMIAEIAERSDEISHFVLRNADVPWKYRKIYRAFRRVSVSRVKVVNENLEDLIAEISKSKGRLATLIVLTKEDDWQECSMVYRKSVEASHHGTNYVFELHHKYPMLMELSADRKKVRIKPACVGEARKLLAKNRVEL